MSPDAPLPEDRPVAPWVERRTEAESLCADLASSSPTAADLEAIRAFAADPKWEVRKVIADALSSLPESLFRELGPTLSNDSNAFVSGAAQRSSERKVPAANLDSSITGKIQKTIDRIASKHGDAAANEAVKLAHMVTERHIRTAVHDIKNILTGLTLDPDKFTEVTAAQRRKLLRCKQGTDYLRHLAEMMAKYAAEPKLKCASESLAEIIAEAHASAVKQIEISGRSVDGVKFSCLVSEEITVRVSRFHIAMVLTNLIKNGMEAHAISPKEMKTGMVVVTAEVSPDEVIVTVSDAGRGVSPSELAQLREFVPGGSSKEKVAGSGGAGTGYGLPICRRYVEAHGGSLTIESTEEIGTLVKFSLPQQEDNRD